MKDLFIRNFEWELLDEKLEIKKLVPNEFVSENSEKIEIWRDESFRFFAKIIGDVNFDFHRDLQPGESHPTFEINGETMNFYEVTLRYCLALSSKVSGFFYRFNKQNEYPFAAQQIQIDNPKERKSEYLIERFLNGSSQGYLYPQTVVSEKEMQRRRVFVFEEDKKIEENIPPLPSHATRACVLIKMDGYQFVIRPIPKEYGPEWSQSIAMEFRASWGYIPDENIRNKISMFISFCFGKHLKNIGYSILDTNGEIIKQICIEPNSSNIKNECKQAPHFPVKFNGKEMCDFKHFVEGKLPVFIELFDKMHFEQALLKVLFANATYLGIGIPIISTAIETIENGWFKSSKSETKGAYFGEEEFLKLIENGVDLISETIPDSEYKGKIINKIKKCNYMGVAERRKYFFNEIGLPIGKAELKFFDQRSKLTHGGDYKHDDNLMDKQMYWRGVGLTLFNRIVLKILSYDGEYIDYAQIGYPMKNIDEPIHFIEEYK